MQILNDLLDSLTIGNPQEFKGVEIFPLLSSRIESTSFLELDEAMEKGVAEVSEVSEAGSVPQIVVVNRSSQDIIIFDGEQLVGAKQNRIVNITVVVPANSTLPIPVSCVEQGRWQYSRPLFQAAQASAYPSLRVSKHEDVTQNMRSRQRADADQSKIWEDISTKSARMNVASRTMAMGDIYENRSPNSAEMNRAFSIQDKQLGYVAFINGGFAGCDVFPSEKVCRRKMEKLTRGYYLDSLDHGVSFDRVEVAEVVRRVRTANHHNLGTVGKGNELRFEGTHIQGSWKEVDGQIVHLTILPKQVRY